jgi:hypothetical protein
MNEYKETLRKVYDHYEAKLEKLENEKDNRFKKGNISETFLKYIHRVI